MAGRRREDDQVVVARRINAGRLAARRGEFRTRALTTDDVSALLGGVGRQAVQRLLARNRLLSLKIAGTVYFPDWQFGTAGPLPGLSRVVEVLMADGRGSLAADALMRTPLDEEDGRTPAQLLAEGDAEAAAHYVMVAGGGS